MAGLLFLNQRKKNKMKLNRQTGQKADEHRPVGKITIIVFL